MPQDIKDHLGFNKEGLLYFSGIILCALGLVLTAFIGFIGVIFNIFGLVLIIITIFMNFKEQSNIGVKIGGLIMKFIVFFIFLALTIVTFVYFS
ncbi:hypothetical protein JW930_04215 [Candidatus Woesearchaeota archaeon]|nr:hypothetical protein [Candidatus Woesearchaeota archaeon]